MSSFDAFSSDKNKKPKKHDRPKRGVKFFFLPKMHGQKHKHKKNTYYVNRRDDWSSASDGSIMSGDSPIHNNRTAEAFDFSSSSNQPAPSLPQLVDSKALTSEADGKQSPVPTTSKDVAVSISRSEEKTGKGEVQASVLVEPGGANKDKDDDEKDEQSSPTLNNSETRDHDREDEGRRNKNDDGGYGGRDKKDRRDDKFRKNGNIDKLDGVWVPNDKKPQEEKEDDNCIVKCLYVTMTCCECTIM